MTEQTLANLPAAVAETVPVPVAPPPPPVKMSSRQARHLAQAVVLEESGTSPLVRFTMLVSGMATLAFIIWSALTHIPEVAMAEGQVIPSGSVQTVQHLEGGIVQEILARDGQLVEAGEPLIRLNPAQALADLDQTRAREATLLIRAERLRAFAAGRQPDFRFVGNSYERLTADNLEIFNTQVQSRDSGRSVILSQIDQKRSDIRLLESQQKALKEQIDVLGEVVKMREELLDKGLVSRVLFLDNKRELARIQGELARIIGQAVTARESLAEAEGRLVDSQSTLTRQTMDELGTVVSELAQVQESLTRLEDRARRVEVISPVRGLVKGMAVKNAGTVIQPGGLVCEVVPVDTEMKVDAKVTTRDIGHLRVGQPVKVKVTTYDFARYGAVTGRLTTLSASSFLDEKGQPYFKAIVALDAGYVGDVPGKFAITPGMTVQAEIVTGDKTLLQYILKPIFTQFQQSFHER